MFSTWYALWRFKNLNRRTFADKVLRDKAFYIAKNSKHDGYQRGLDKKVYSHFIDNTWGADLADMQLLSKFNKGFRFLLNVIDIYCKYAWVIPLKDKKGITITNAFQKILKESYLKPNKMWVDKVSEFYNTSMKSWLEKNGMEMYSAHNEGKSVIGERFIRTLKNKICKYMTSVSKIVYVDKLNDILNKHNNTYHNIIKMKPADVSDTYIEFSKQINNKDLNFQISDTVRISKYKNIFVKGLHLYLVWRSFCD